MENLQEQINKIQDTLDSLKDNARMPKEFGDAMKARLDIIPSDSTTTAASQTQAVSESGSGSYSVAKPMTGFFRLTIKGRIYNIPYY